MSAAPLRGDGTSEVALALQRVLALEGRNALARVELAASELSRFALVPGALERIVAIRDAVGELDALLDKIERLADPARGACTGAASTLVDAWSAVRSRVEPVLAARDIQLELAGGLETMPLALPSEVLERLLLLTLRTAVAAIEREEAEVDGAAPHALRMAARVAPSPAASQAARGAGDGAGVELELRAQRAGIGIRLPIERVERVELEVALAEWHGRLASLDDADGTGLAVWLPGSAGDAC